MHGMWTRPVPEYLLILSDISNDGGRKGPGAANARESQRYGRERAFLYSRDAHRIPLPALREHSRENQIKPQKSENVMYTQTGMLSRSKSFSRRGSGSPGGIFQWTSMGPSDSPTFPCDIDRDRRKCSIRTGILCESCCFCCAVRPNVPNPPVSRTDSVIARRELTLRGTNAY